MTNSQMTNQTQSSKGRSFDLEERTAKFGIEAIKFCKSVAKSEITRPLINQLMRSATSIGANYMEANGADSKRDFQAKISICKKESKETMHWLRMFGEAEPERVDEARRLWREVHELSLIFGAINRK